MAPYSGDGEAETTKSNWVQITAMVRAENRSCVALSRDRGFARMASKTPKIIGGENSAR